MPTILAIDDKSDNLITVSALLKMMMPEATVQTAQSGQDGIAQAKASLPDVILLDIVMPEMDGYEACRRLRADSATQHIPIIMLTALETDTPSRIKGLQAGADAFLTKPADEGELCAQINVMLRIRRAEALLKEKVQDRTIELEKTNRKLQAELRQRRQAEQALEDSRMQLDAFFADSPAGLAIFDSQFCYVKINKTLAEINGSSVAEHIGQSVDQVLPQLAPTLVPMFRNVISESKSYLNVTVEGETPGCPGEMRQWLVSYFPIKALDGPVSGIGAIVIETTERKQAEEATRNSEARFRAVFEQAGGYCMILDPNSPDGIPVIVDANRAACLVHG